MSPVNITATRTVLDVVGQYRSTEDVFRRYDDRAGECILCQALFEPLDRMAARYGLDLDALLDDLRRAAEREEAADQPAENDRRRS